VKNKQSSQNLRKTLNVQFRAEFFNVLNNPNFAPPVNNLEAFDPSGNLTPGFGQITNLQVPSREGSVRAEVRLVMVGPQLREQEYRQPLVHPEP